jgi:hypothetical protein
VAELKVFFVHLRRPKNAKDRRDDPFYEVGSFGCTGCHSKNLLHPKNASKLKGARLAFVQGGRRGARLVFLTPPVRVVKRWMKRQKGKWVPIREVQWKPAEMPLKYAAAPVLVSNDGHSDFPSVMKVASLTQCPSLVSGLSSLLRSRTEELKEPMAKEVARVYKKWRRKAVVSISGIASKYYETMSPAPQNPDTTRKATYRNNIKEMIADIDGIEAALKAVVPPGTRVLSCCGKPSRLTDRRVKRC